MSPYKSEKTANTPEIDFSPSGNLLLKGRSIPENTIKFYAPALEWIQNYTASPSANTVLEVYLEYFNTASAKVIMDVFKLLEKIHVEKKSNCLVKWIYDEFDEDMQEAGEDYKSAFTVPFEIITSKK